MMYSETKSEPQEQLKQEMVLKNKEDCCGCYACSNACPKKCISMDKDSEGFWYPHINPQECIHCNKCQKVCPVLNSSSNANKSIAYLGLNNNPLVRKNSSSGGIFTAIAEKIIDMGGAVFGCSFNESFEVEHICVETKEELERLQGSKYVQSRIGDTYSRVKLYLLEGRTVLFTGTPCQIEGLISFLGDTDTNNLYTQDIICHGVPSPGVWKEYLDYRSKGDEIKSVSFRDKKYGWHYFSMNIETDKRHYTKRLDEDLFLRLFLDNTILRPSCHNCKFKKEIRISDFTLADCWRPESVKSQLIDDDKGLSMFFLNTEKAKALFEIIKNNCTLQEIDYDLAINSQKVATSSVKPNIHRQDFFAEFNNKGIKHIDENLYRLNMMQRMKKRLIYHKTRLAKKLRR